MNAYKTKLLTTSAIMAAGLLLYGCERQSTEPQTDQAGQTITTEDGSGDDLNITTAVHTAIRAEQRLSQLNIQVDTRKGDVRLYGQVETEEQRDMVERIAKGTPGVHSVRNELEVK